MDQLVEQAARRVDARKKKVEELAKEAEEIKNRGNEKFKKGDYLGAAEAYIHAINYSGPTPVLLSNLAAAYFKLNHFEESLWAATTALEYDPRFLKARFRRAMARKELSLYKAAVKDLEIIIAEQPDNEAAQQELKAIRTILQHDQGLNVNATERDHPRFDAEPWETYMDSGTEDSQHFGNLTPCRFYNHAGCIRGSQCRFSHAPDDDSVRDELGKNVCLKFLFESCKFGDAKCIYSHDKRFLPAGGWWNDPAKVQAAKALRRESDFHDILEFDLHSALMEYPKASGFAAKLQREEVTEQVNLGYAMVEETVGMTAPHTTPSHERFVLLLCFEQYELFNPINTHLLSALRNKIKVVEVRESPNSIETALRHLAMPNLAGVLVADPSVIKRKYTALVSKLVEYVKNGGSVALAGQFSNHITPPDFDKFMKHSWGLDWKFGAYHRMTFKTNPANELVRRNPSLDGSYSMKSVHVADILPEMAMYVPIEGARLQSLVFAATKIKDTSESPAVCARVGRGLLSFLGDVNGEDSSTNTILAMLGLLDEPNVPLASPPSAASTSSTAAGPSTAQRGQSGTTYENGKNKKKKQSKSQKSSQRSEDRAERTGYAVISDDDEVQVRTDYIMGPRSERVESTGYAVVSDDDDDDETEVMTEYVIGSRSEGVERTGYAVVSEDNIPRVGIAIAPQDLIENTGITVECSSKFVLIVALANAEMFARIYAHQISALKKKVEVKTAVTASQALVHLTSPDICAVYIVDEGIARPTNSLVLTKIVDYIKAGGQAVIGGLFPSMTTPPDITKTLSNFGVPWRAGSYSRTEAERNGHHEAAIKNPSLSEAFYMKAVHLTGFHAEELFYEQYPQNTDDWEAPILRTRLGKGHLGYNGDVNAETESTDIVLAMLELLTPKRAIVPDSKKFFMILTSYHEQKEVMDRFLNKFIEDAKEKAEVLYGLSNARVIDLLPSRDLLGILITDPYILDIENEYLLSKVVEYSKQGGTVVFGSVFSLQVTLTQFRPLFRDNWGLDWDFCIGPQDTKVTKNSKNSLAKKMDDLKVPKTFQINGIYVRGIAPSMAVYIPQNRPNLWKPADNNFSSSIIYTDVEKGHLGFIGVNSMDDEIRTIFYTMIGLS